MAHIPPELAESMGEWGWEHPSQVPQNSGGTGASAWSARLVQPFQPAIHEAVMSEASTEVENGHVIATLQKGYSYGDRTLRPALVKVAQ